MDISQQKHIKSLSTTVFEQIRDDILANKYEIGEKLVESQMALEMNISRTPIREALKQLELEGLIEHIPNRGMIVKGISKQDVEDIYQVRAILEELAVKWSMERNPSDWVDTLTEIYDLMEFYTFKNEFKKFMELSTQFHETIYASSNSRYLEHVLSDYQSYVKISRNISIQSKGRMEESLKEYAAILEHIKAGNVEQACQAMMDHICHIRHKI